MADRLDVNPYTQQCPNFNAPHFQQFRDAISARDPDADAVAALAEAWRVGNEEDRARWDTQVAADEDHLRHQPRPPPPPPPPPQPNNPPVPPLLLPDAPKGIQFTKGKAIGHLSDQVCQYTRNHLKKFEYVEMWYFMKQGLEATKNSNTSVGEGYTFVDSKEGTLLRPVNKFKAHKYAIADENLSWNDISAAQHLFLLEVEALKWGEDTVTALHAFFYNLDSHEVQRREDGDLILAQYQTDICKKWHNCIERKEEVFDISVINSAVMLQSEKIVFNRQRIQQKQEDVERV